MIEKVFLAATGNCLTWVEFTAGKWNVTKHLRGQQINCLAKDPDKPQHINAGSQEHDLWISENIGRNWEHSGKTELPVKSPVIRLRNYRESKVRPNTIYAGCKTVYLFSSQDGEKTWSIHKLSAQMDCYSLKFHHTQGEYVYQGERFGTALDKDG